MSEQHDFFIYFFKVVLEKQWEIIIFVTTR